MNLLAKPAPTSAPGTIKTRGYAAKDSSGKLSRWEFERRPVGDKAGVGCIVDSCLQGENCKHGAEQFCEVGIVSTYGAADKSSPSGITQGGYSTHIVVRDHFAIHIPDQIPLQQAAPVLCAGITTYSTLVNANLNNNAH